MYAGDAICPRCGTKTTPAQKSARHSSNCDGRSLLFPKRFRCFAHTLDYADAERAALLARAARQTVARVRFKRRVLRAHGILRRCTRTQHVKTAVHRRNVDAHGARMTVVAVYALTRSAKLGCTGQYLGIVARRGWRVLIGKRRRDLLRRLTTNQRGRRALSFRPVSPANARSPVRSPKRTSRSFPMYGIP